MLSPQTWVIISFGSTKPLPEPMLTYHRWSLIAFTIWHKLLNRSTTHVWNHTFKLTATSPWDQWVNIFKPHYISLKSKSHHNDSLVVMISSGSSNFSSHPLQWNGKVIILMKWRSHHFDEIFVTGSSKSCQNDNFCCSQWWKFHQNDGISV